LELNAVRQWPSRTESGHPLQPAAVPVSLITLPVQPNKTKQKKLLFFGKYCISSKSDWCVLVNFNEENNNDN